MPRATAPAASRESTCFECTICRLPMTESPQSSSQVRYFQCPRCGRWATSMYREVLRKDAGFRERPVSSPEQKVDFDQIKARMEAWIAYLDASDPHQVLGVPYQASPEQIRERYRQLARQHHPDKGGDPARMRAVNEAYERLRNRVRR